MRNANEGISLAAIVAKETTTGKWNGTGGGIGLGTGGIGLFIGGVSGSKQEQTQRAKNFESPKEEEYSLLNVYGSIIKVLVFGVLFGLSARLFTFLSDTGSDFAEPVTTTTATDNHHSHRKDSIYSGWHGRNGKHFRHRCPFFSNYHSNDLVSVFQQQTRKRRVNTS
ncbi:hypothetical protein [Escherichia coli]|uniref:hypothetical protein n=1 Tax=Escherichia coli TaxID=562 RepID=UPI000AA4D059|nr:hypothetical protein [Escherichia coli]